MRRSCRNLPLLTTLVSLCLAGCAEQPVALLPGQANGLDGPAAPANALATLICEASVRTRSVSCSAPTATAPNGADPIIIGGQGTYVQLTSSDIQVSEYHFDPAYMYFSFKVAVQNLLPQPLGTTNGTTPHFAGVRVFFHEGPTVTGGSGSISIENANGEAAFLSAGQTFFQYSEAELGGDGILSPNEASAQKTWQLVIDDNVTTFTFKVYVSAAVQFEDGWVDVTPATDMMLDGADQVLTTTVRNALGDVIAGGPVTWGTLNSTVATVDAAGNVTAVSPGSATITAISSGRIGFTTVQVCPDLELGEAYVVEMPKAAQICLGAGPGNTAREYTVIPVSDAASVPLTVTSTGIVAVSGEPTPSVIPGGARMLMQPGEQPKRNEEFELALRKREREQLRNLRPLTRLQLQRRQDTRQARVPGGISAAIVPGVPAIGALMTLNVSTAHPCLALNMRTGRVMAVGTHIIVMADTLNPVDGLTAAEYAAVADSFDTKVYPLMTNTFGAPADIDGNGRVIAFFTSAVNELSYDFISGFVYTRDLFDPASCPGSNAGEMFYMAAADPSGGVLGIPLPRSFILREAKLTLAHEFQHLINASRRMYVNTPWNGQFEETFMEEGLAGIAEELMFYHTSGLTPKSNVGPADLFGCPAPYIGFGCNGPRTIAFFDYAAQNFHRLYSWLLAPHRSGPFSTVDGQAMRGASWAFLRYAADHSGVADQQQIWHSLVNTPNTGRANLNAVFGSVDPLYSSFAAAMYADDAGLSAVGALTQPSWNFRELYTAVLLLNPGPDMTSRYELAVRNPANGVGEAFTLAAGGAAAYLRIGVAANAFAGVTTLSNGATPPNGVKVVVVRRK